MTIEALKRFADSYEADDREGARYHIQIFFENTTLQEFKKENLRSFQEAFIWLEIFVFTDLDIDPGNGAVTLFVREVNSFVINQFRQRTAQPKTCPVANQEKFEAPDNLVCPSDYKKYSPLT